MLHTPTILRAVWASLFSLSLTPSVGCTCQSEPPNAPRLAKRAEPSPSNLEATSELEPWSDAWLLERGEHYLQDGAHRRSSMVRSLRNPKNLYSRQRIAAYGHQTKGWDALPVWNPRSEVLQIEPPLQPPKRTLVKIEDRVWDKAKPQTMEDWRSLGKTVFHRYPLRADAFIEFGVQSAERMKRFGLHLDSEGRAPGVVRFVDVDGKTRVGITCALCHSSVRNGKTIDGIARRNFDYGALRLAMHETTKMPVDPELARRMATWGPGRADITEDEAEDPVTIPDLWDLQHYESLTQAGTIRHIGPIALALRQETQLLHANHQRTRPPRELAWALAMYMYSLEPPPRANDWRAPDPTRVEAGKKLFAEHCERCHSNPAGGGPVVDAPKLGTDQALAFGVARGTGKYRPPNLTRVSEAAPYFHTGAVPNLMELFDPARREPNYAGAGGRRGAAQGHDYGLDWNDADKAAMIAYLRSL